jgi:Xaa-Pro aminopeptidase
MLAAARPLTWIEELLPLRDAAALVEGWRRELGSQAFALLNGDAMPLGLRQSIATALGSPTDMTQTVAAAMRRKSARELDLMREACATLDATLAAMRAAQRAARGMTDVVLAGERVARQRGAQDVRSLFGRDGTLAPFWVPVAAAADPMQVYVAVRHDGYWAEGFAVLGAAPPAAAEARAVLHAAIALAKPGAPQRELARYLAAKISVERRHPAIRQTFGGAIGLALPQPGCLTEGSNGRFAPGETYTVRVGLTGSSGSAMVSAMVAITEDGPDILWAGGDS